MRSKINILQYVVTYETYGDTFKCVDISPKTYGKLKNGDASDWYCPICVRNVPFSDLKAK